MSWTKWKCNPLRRAPVKAGLLLGLFLFVLGMAQFEALHRAAHPDAGQAHHQCAVTFLQAGQVDVAGSAVSVPTPALKIVSFLPQLSPFLAAVEHSLPPDRGPPVLPV